MKKKLFIATGIALLLTAISACSFLEKNTELKSPCVAADTGANTHGQHPCARRPANANWLG